MKNELKFGIQANGIKHAHIDLMPTIDDRFRMVKDTGIFDYVDKTPEVNEINDFKFASQKHKLTEVFSRQMGDGRSRIQLHSALSRIY